MKKINLIAADIGAGSGRIYLSSYDGNKISSNQVHRFSNSPILLGSTLYWDVLRIVDELGKGQWLGELCIAPANDVGLDLFCRGAV